MLAVISNHTDTVRLLLDRGADADLTSWVRCHLRVKLPE